MPTTGLRRPAPQTDQAPTLRRSLSLPLLVFYGLGVTVGAGIFALVGEILDVSGDHAPLAFLLAGVISGFTGVSYMALVAQFPRAGGEAVYVSRGIGPRVGRIAGIGVVTTGTISSAVVALAFAGYITTLIDIPKLLAALLIVAALVLVACWGVRESVLLAAAVTILEVGTLIIVVFFGLPEVDMTAVSAAVDLSDGGLTPIIAGAGISFFAFIGFEDIANMAEETIDPRRTAPRAIAWTLIITLAAYIFLALVAVSLPERSSIVDSDAPMSVIFEAVSGLDPAPIATIASFAMINGILVQIVMASRVLYGMSNEGQAPTFWAQVHGERQTPTRATVSVGVVIALLVLFFPLVTLAKATSIVILAVFTLVNLALVRLSRTHAALSHTKWLVNASAGAITAGSLCLWQLATW